MIQDKVSQAGGPASAPPPPQTRPLHRILVVDDDDFVRQLNTRVLVKSGYNVDAAEDGAVAWDTLQLNGYDLLVTDNKMPKVTGVELLQKLHAARIFLPVIMATGTLPDEEFARSPWLQPAATLLKPYSNAELLATVEDVLCATTEARVQIEPSLAGSPCQSSADGWQL